MQSVPASPLTWLFVGPGDHWGQSILNENTNKTQRIALLLDAADFAKFFSIEDFQQYMSYRKSNKYDWIRTSDGKGCISILTQIILQS